MTSRFQRTTSVGAAAGTGQNKSKRSLPPRGRLALFLFVRQLLNAGWTNVSSYYPMDHEKKSLAEAGRLDINQVSGWFTNQRRRLFLKESREMSAEVDREIAAAREELRKQALSDDDGRHDNDDLHSNRSNSVSSIETNNGDGSELYAGEEDDDVISGGPDRVQHRASPGRKRRVSNVDRLLVAAAIIDQCSATGVERRETLWLPLLMLVEAATAW